MQPSPPLPAEALLAERRRLGLDRADELWEGVLHMVPPPSGPHARRATELLLALAPIARRRGLIAYGDGVGLYAPEPRPISYRCPDVALARPDQESERGLEGAVLVVEVLSPDDDSRAKLPFYGRIGVEEVWLIDPRTRALELFTFAGGAPTPAPADHSPRLGIGLALVAGPRLRLVDGDAVHEV
jgi:Uma2 family endonuclease